MLRRSGEIIGENQRITVYEALKAVTINAAYEYFEEAEKEELKDIRVCRTIKDGKCLYRAT